MSPRPIPSTVIAALICAALSGCVSPVSGAVPSTSRSPAAPIFATDEEALAAATKAYGDYLAVADQVAQDGGAGVERLAPFVTPKYMKIEIDEYAQIKSGLKRMTGSMQFRTVRLQRSATRGGFAEVDLYVCVDVSKVRVLDGSGTDVTSTTRLDKYPLIIGLKSSHSHPRYLKVDVSDVWQGENFC